MKHCLPLLLLPLLVTGCGRFMALRMVQSPNTYPVWLAPAAPVQLAFSEFWMTNFPEQYVNVGPPEARLRYRVIEPADYGMRVESTNWIAHGKPLVQFTIKSKMPGTTNQWSARPRGTVLLLHGYGLAQFAMAPWGLHLAQEGWRAVLVDLRGHGKSSGKRIYYGIQETGDLSQLVDAMDTKGQLIEPVSAVGESYGAALAVRWQTCEPRVKSVVAIAPYTVLSNAVINICREYSDWMPKVWVRAGLRKLPALIGVGADALNIDCVLAEHPVTALFVAGSEDKIIPESEVRRLSTMAGPESRFLVVPDASHETVPYYFTELSEPVVEWLGGNSRGASSP